MSRRLSRTQAYERWLHKRVDVVESDVALKHQQMRESVFAFLRGTFYRWASLWQETSPHLDKSPRVMAVGDLHVENFGTWRDTEGRLGSLLIPLMLICLVIGFGTLATRFRSRSA